MGVIEGTSYTVLIIAGLAFAGAHLLLDLLLTRSNADFLSSLASVHPGKL